MDNFKVPASAAQDLLLIQSLIDTPQPVRPSGQPAKPKDDSDSSIDSSDSDVSENEIVAELLVVKEDEKPQQPIPSDSESTSDSESSDSESSDSDKDEDPSRTLKAEALADYEDEDEESGVATAKEAAPQTKNEIVDVEIAIPDIEEAGPDEILEKVGEIIMMMEKVVIVKGMESTVPGRGAERALDTDTLLVFDDRKVLGYIAETFGPTSQPLYQIKFNHAYPIDPQKVRIGRDVYHLPQRSNFVFIGQLTSLKGSDASTWHDEEPPEHELEFSDDEAEAAYKSIKKRKRAESRASSLAPSTSSTSAPSQMLDHDPGNNRNFGVDMYSEGMSRKYLGDAYAESSPYDADFVSGPSRPAPSPYDDPYSDAYTPADSVTTTPPRPEVRRRDRSQSIIGNAVDAGSRNAERSEERGRRPERRGRGRGDRGARGRGRGGRQGSWNGAPGPSRSMSPTSAAIARATGQFSNDSYYDQSPSPSVPLGQVAWSHPQQGYAMNPPFMGSQPFVQPHINPRFAAAFAMNMGFVPQAQQLSQHRMMDSSMHGPYGAGSRTSNAPANWADEWTVPMDTEVPDNGSSTSQQHDTRT